MKTLIILDADGALPEYLPEMKSGEVLHAPGIDAITTLSGGMSSGAPSVGLWMRTVDGTLVFAETSVKIFLTAANAMAARYPELTTTSSSSSSSSS